MQSVSCGTSAVAMEVPAESVATADVQQNTLSSLAGKSEIMLYWQLYNYTEFFDEYLEYFCCKV